MAGPGLEPHGRADPPRYARAVPPGADVPALDICVFGTYDEDAHPRVRGLREGLEASGARVTVLNEPLGVDTGARVQLLRRPAGIASFALTLAARWLRLVARRRIAGTPDAVLVGYLGHFDVHLAKVLFRRSTIVLDHMVGLSDTATDRQLDGRSIVSRLLGALDRAALRAADIVLFDTDEHRQHLDVAGVGGIVVPVGAPSPYFDAGKAHAAETGTGGPLRVLFYGLYTPLQGAATIGQAMAQLAGDEAVCFTMVGTGQDRTAAEQAAAGARATWTDWVPADELPALIASHDVCLGIFGTSPKARRVVPNKVFQGAAAGAAVVTSDTPCQRSMLGPAAAYVPPGDPTALAACLRDLASHPDRLRALQHAGREVAAARFAPAAAVRPLLDELQRRSTDTAR
jgi:glycosyltransferase involved in cell wall biosynthesis